jgi:CheY-like chemotaxis protein
MKDVNRRILNILIADDDSDDRFLFDIALNEVSIPHKLISVSNGQQLMNYLNAKGHTLPDVLILDLNMPLKNGGECVIEIKKMETLKNLPIIIYSTSLQDAVADVLYQNGVHYYLQKTDISALVPPLKYVLTKIYNQETEQPARDKFILNPKQQGRLKYS